MDDSDGDPEKGRVNLVLPQGQKEKWEQYVEEDSTVGSLSALVRMSVEKEINEDTQTDEEQIRQVLRQELNQQEEKLDQIHRETRDIRSGQLSNDDVVNMVTTATIANEDYFDLIKQATMEGMEEQSITGIDATVLEGIINSAKEDSDE